MAQWSFAHEGIVTGDCGPYTSGQFALMMRDTMGVLSSAEGVIAGAGNELAATGVVSPVVVDTGAALVDGRYYNSSAAENIIVPTAAGGARVDWLVLRYSLATKTVRLLLLANGAGFTQNHNVTWDLPLWQVDVTIGDVITLIDVRERIHPTAPIYRRLGDDPDDWDTDAGLGTTVYAPGRSVIQCGQEVIMLSPGGPPATGETLITFPVPFAYRPLIFLTCRNSILRPTLSAYWVGPGDDPAAVFRLSVYEFVAGGGGGTTKIYCNWMAIGPL